MNPIADTTTLEKFTLLASQFGPFFFAILFVVFVPLLGQKYFSDFVKQTGVSAGERQIALKVHRFYWLSGICMGLALVALSVAWWFYMQFKQAPIRIAVVEAIIHNSSDDDVFMYDILSKEYTVYAYHLSWINPPVTKVAIILKGEPKAKQTINLQYMNKNGFALALEQKIAIKPFVVPFCLDHKDVTFVRGERSDPHFDKQC